MKSRTQIKHNLELTQAELCDIVVDYLKQQGHITEECSVLKHNIQESVTIEVITNIIETVLSVETKVEHNTTHQINDTVQANLIDSTLIDSTSDVSSESTTQRLDPVSKEVVDIWNCEEKTQLIQKDHPVYSSGNIKTKDLFADS